MKTILAIVVVVVLASVLAACRNAPTGPSSEQKTMPTPVAPTAAAPAATASPLSINLLAPEKATETAPSTYRARFTTTKGDFVVEVTRDWSPNGADRFYNLVKAGYFDDISFFRAVEGFMVQFGIHGSPEVSAKWRAASIADDPLKGISNQRGTITFATAGPNTRTTQIFINYRDNGNLDGMGFTPFGKVVQGMDVVDSLYKGYGDAAAFGGHGPDQGRMQMEGNAYLKKDFPMMDYVMTAKIEL